MEAGEKVKRLYKSRTDRMIDGVCGGVAEYLGVDPVLIRIAFLLLVFAGGIGVVVYLIGMLLMPAGSVPLTPAPNASAAPDAGAPATPDVTPSAIPAGTSPSPVRSTDSTARIIGIGFVVLGGILLLGNLGISFWEHWWGFSWSALGPILVIVAGVALILRSPRTGAASAIPAQGAGAPDAGVNAASGTGHLYRSRLDRKLLGICGGLGVYLAVDPTILRLLFVISAIASFGGTILLYLITAIIIPAEPLAARPA